MILIALVMIILLILNIPIYLVLLSGSLVYFINSTDTNTMIFAQRLISGTESIPLLSIPFFVCAGVFMNYSGITKRMVSFTKVLTGHMDGGLAQVNVVLSTLMGGLSGSNLADAAMQSKIIVPEMEKDGYSKSFSAVVTAASSLITPIIPPGIALILYGYIANVSIGQMFVAGVLPGIVLCLIMMLLVDILSKKRGYKKIYQQRASFKEILVAFVPVMSAVLLPVIIIGGIRFGIFTPTEAGGMAVVFALFLGICYRELTWKKFNDGLLESAVISAAVMIIIAASSIFSWILTWERIPSLVTTVMLEMTSNKYLFLILVNCLLIFVGMFLEGGAAMLILIPLLLPTVKALDIDLVHFGIIFIVNMSIGNITPPIGTVMFTVCSITKTPIEDFIKDAIPFYIMLVLVLLFITFVPAISTFLPNLIYGK